MNERNLMLVLLSAMGIFFVLYALWYLATLVSAQASSDSRSYTCLDVAVRQQIRCADATNEPCAIFGDVYNACLDELDAGNRVCVDPERATCPGYVEPKEQP